MTGDPQWREVATVLRRRGATEAQIVAETLRAHGITVTHPHDVRFSLICMRDPALTSWLRIEVRTTPTPPRVRRKPRHSS